MHGHSLVGTPCVEIMRNMQSPNITLNLLCGANGLMHANTVNGASDTLVFLQFFDEASHCLQPDGGPVLEYGDHIIVDYTSPFGGSSSRGMVGRYRMCPCLFTVVYA